MLIVVRATYSLLSALFFPNPIKLFTELVNLGNSAYYIRQQAAIFLGLTPPRDNPFPAKSLRTFLIGNCVYAGLHLIALTTLLAW